MKNAEALKGLCAPTEVQADGLPLKDLKLGILGFTLATIFIGLRQFKKLKEYDRVYTKILGILYLNFIVFGNVLMLVFFGN